MRPNMMQRVLGALLLLMPPIFFVNLSFIINYNSAIEIVFFVVLVLLYTTVMLSRIDYSSSLMGRINFEGIPTGVEEAFVETNLRGDYVNVAIMRMLGRNRKISQSEATRWLNAKGVSLTQPAVVKYLGKLEEGGFLSSVDTTYLKQYSLSEKGEAALRAMDQVLPQRYFWFIIRNEIGFRTFKPINSVVAS